MEEMCKRLAPDALEALEGLLNSSNEKVRLEAIQQVLDRGYGKAVDRVQIASVDAGGQRPEQLGMDDLLALANRERDSGVTIEGEAQLLSHSSTDSLSDVD